MRVVMEVENDAKPRLDANETGTLVIDMHTRIVTFQRNEGNTTLSVMIRFMLHAFHHVLKMS